MNQWNGIGRLTKDIETKQTTNSVVANFTLAVDRPYAKEGQQKTDFISCVAFGKTAEFMEKYMQKGTRIGVTGSIQTRTWEDKDNNKHYVTEILVNNVYFADGKSSSGGNKPTSSEDEEFEL